MKTKKRKVSCYDCKFSESKFDNMFDVKRKLYLFCVKGEPHLVNSVDRTIKEHIIPEWCPEKGVPVEN